MMRRSAALATYVLTLGAAAVSFGCETVDDDGGLTLVGTYTVDLTLKANSCGVGGLDLPGYVQRNADIKGYAGEAASFEWTELGSGPASGSASTTGVYRFVQRATTELLAADPFYSYPGCSVLQQTEIVFTLDPTPVRPPDGGTADGGLDAGALDAGVASGALEGTLTIDVVPTSGSDCSPLVGANGGPFVMLPCQATMTLSGTRAN